MKKLIFLVVMITSLAPYCEAQKLDTIYLNEWFLTANKNNYAYYRIVQKHPRKDSIYVQTDYFVTGEVKQMGFYYTTSNKAITNKNFDKLISKNLLVKEGNWVSYASPGKVHNFRCFEKGNITFAYGLDQSTGDTIYQYVDRMPAFPSGPQALREYVSRGIRYPYDAASAQISGKVYVTFIISEKGEVQNIKIARGLFPSIDEEALRVVSTLPNFSPGIQKGKPVKVSYTIPIKFQLQ